MATYYNTSNQRDVMPTLYLGDPGHAPYPESSLPSSMVYMNYSSAGSYSDHLASNSQPQQNCIELPVPTAMLSQDSSVGPSVSASSHQGILSNLVSSRLGEQAYGVWRDGRNEMMFMQPTSALTTMQAISGQMNDNTDDLVRHPGREETHMDFRTQLGILQSGQSFQSQRPDVSAIQGQGLSLSLSTQIPSTIQVPSFQYHRHTNEDISFLGSHQSTSGDGGLCRDDGSHTKQSRNAEFSPAYSGGGHPIKGEMLGSNNQCSAALKQMNTDPSYGFAGLSSTIPNSKYLKAAQQLLDEVVNVRKALKQDSEKRQSFNMSVGISGSKDTDGGSKGGVLPPTDGIPANPQDLTSNSTSELSPAERQDLQNKMTKLLTMLDEVDRRYKQYYHQMQIVVSSFDMIAGCGAAKPYTALALQTISRHFRSLRDAIGSQIKATRMSLGEQDSLSCKGGGISRLRFVDQQLRQQRALQQIGMIQQHAWRPQRGLPESSVSILRAWLFEHFLHPYPKDSDKIMLARQTGLTRSQVSPNCQSSMLQGRRAHQEDRTVCALDMRIPFPDQMGVKEVSVGMIAVFDGHNGAEASEMASKLLLEYFFLHIYFLLDGIYSFAFKKSSDRLLHREQHDVIFQGLNLDKDLESHRIKLIYPQIFNGAFHKEILKESLLRTIRDIDATFFKEAYKNNLESGSTATIVLIADGQILVANVGDSKALLCSERFLSTQEFKGTLSKLHRRRRRNNAVSLMRENENSKSVTSGRSTYFCVRELTEDHHPDRDDERTRVEAAGGYVIEWGGVPRVNGELALSRAIGDVSFRSYGVIPVPEVTDWQPLTGNDSYLVAATDGVFEKLITQDVCDILWDVHMHGNGKSEFCSTGAVSLADCIVNTAFAKGSMDNIAAVVVPLRSSGVPGIVQNERCDLERVHSSASELPNLIHLKSANDAIGSGLIPMEFVQQITAKFNKLLVEGEQNKFGCFYLSESLNENLDYVFLPRTDDEKIESYDPAQALAEFHGHPHSGGTLGLYNDQYLCLHFGMDLGGGEGQCINPEGFARFLGLLESVPFYDSDIGFNSSASFGSETPNFRYILKRRFDRGSYGEVWLAFHWNCSQNGDALNQMSKSKTSPVSIVRLDPHNLSLETNSSQHQCFNDTTSDDLFILKRIMVERGTNAYLSGLREKYFGEVFLNASLSLGGLLSASSSKFHQKEAEYDDSDLLKTNESLLHEMGYIWNPSDIFTHNSRLLTADHEEGLMHIARYIESFESRLKEIWLVFRNEGLSLSKLIYTTEETKISTDTERDEYVNNFQVMHPSQWWHWLRTTEEGKMEMCNLIRQLLLALKSCHDRNITHRDIKPENMVICFEDEDTGRCLRGSPNGGKHYRIKMRIIDFGSAIDDFTIKNLYGSNGPSRSEETFEYTPPEALLNYSWFQGPPSLTLKYDMWSVGVVMLELILGSPHVFQISARTRALLDKHLEGWSEDIKELAFKLRSFMEMCILIPGSSPQNHWVSGLKDHSRVWPASWKCSEEFFSQQVKSRDPLKLGFPNVWAMRLVRQLLVWHPEDRLSVDDALHHPYFQSYPQR